MFNLRCEFRRGADDPSSRSLNPSICSFEQYRRLYRTVRNVVIPVIMVGEIASWRHFRQIGSVRPRFTKTSEYNEPVLSISLYLAQEHFVVTATESSCVKGSALVWTI